MQEALTALEQNDMLQKVVAANETGEWIELLLLSIYSVELTHAFTTFFEWRDVPAGAAAGAIMIVTAVGYWLFHGFPGMKPPTPLQWRPKLLVATILLVGIIGGLAFLGQKVFPRNGTIETERLLSEIQQQQSALAAPEFQTLVHHPSIRILIDEGWHEVDVAKRDEEHRPEAESQLLIRAVGFFDGALSLARDAALAHKAEDRFYAMCPEKCRNRMPTWPNRKSTLDRDWQDGDFQRVLTGYQELSSQIQSPPPK